MGDCYIIGAGEFFENSLAVKPDDFIIAADGGYVYLEKIGLKPDLYMGDFDSAPMPDDGNIAVFNSEKDDTDTMLAVKHGLTLGFRTFHIYGGTGGRFDHTFANIQALAHIAHSGGRGFLYGEKTVLTVIVSDITFDEFYKGKISVFSLDEKATGVCETGLKYALERAVLSNSDPLGVSNEFTGKPSEISVEHGTLLIVHNRKD